MNRTLPTTDEELRDWLVQAWEAGWKARRSLIGKTMGSLIADKPRMQAEFLRSLDLPRKNAAAVELGRKGGLARAKTISKSKRAEIARKAARARWNRK